MDFKLNIAADNKITQLDSNKIYDHIILGQNLPVLQLLYM